MDFNVVFDTKNKVAIVDNVVVLNFEFIEKLYNAYCDVNKNNVKELHVKGDK